jgi:hypothetical protein
MLFTDGIILGIEDLREHDNFVLDVASTEAIELSSKLAVAQREIGYELSSFLMTRCCGTGLGQVVVTQQLKDLLATHTLSIVYRDAYNLHLNDRYLGRWKEFTNSSQRSLLRFFQSGVGIAAVAVPQAPKADVTVIGGGGLASGSYYVQVAWQHVGGNVGGKSIPAMADISGGSLKINPGNAPANINGWHVFIGMQEDVATRQNETPIALGTTWTQAAALRQDLTGPDAGGPDYYVRNSGQIARG